MELDRCEVVCPTTRTPSSARMGDLETRAGKALQFRGRLDLGVVAFVVDVMFRTLCLKHFSCEQACLSDRSSQGGGREVEGEGSLGHGVGSDNVFHGES